ncbi:MAG: flagellar export chaperone FliS [Pseudomonadota bacterium]
MTANARQIHARSAYASVAATTRTEGASPHRLVELLFEECLASMKRAELGLLNGAMAIATPAAAKAGAILDALTASLDFEQGGRIAGDLAAIYDYCRSRLRTGIASGTVADIESAQVMLAEIASGWAAIGDRNATP